MTTSQPTSTNSVNEAWDPYNVIAVSFEDDRDAYKSLTTLKELDSQQRVGVHEAVVVARDQDGRVVEKDTSDSMFMAGTAGGGLIGLLIGIIGGPLGMLIGGLSGLLLGSLYDISSADETESALGAVSSSVKPGLIAIFAIADRTLAASPTTPGSAPCSAIAVGASDEFALDLLPELAAVPVCRA
jgi:uncharacterized membrane protein